MIAPRISRTPEYLQHMLDACRRIVSYIEGLDRAGFDANPRTWDAVIRNPELIGEAAQNVLNSDPDFAATHAEIPWALADWMRNALRHGYASVSLATVWHTISEHTPVLEQQLLTLLGEDRTQL